MQIEKLTEKLFVGRTAFTTKAKEAFLKTICRRLDLDKQTCVIFQRRDRFCKQVLSTIIALAPSAIVKLQGNSATVQIENRKEALHENIGCPFQFLDSLKEKLVPDSAALEALLPGEIEFAGGLIGYLGYGLVSQIENIDRQEHDPFSIPDATLMVPGIVLYFDHACGLLSIISHRGIDELKCLFDKIGLDARPHEALPPSRSTPKSCSFDQALAERLISSSVSKEEFLKRVVCAKQSIEAGDAFQIVLSQRFSGPASDDGLNLFLQLCEASPSAYNYIINLPSFQYIGSSPETMLSIKQGVARLCALAGTRPRGKDKQQDKENELDLTSNEKELAEHLMLVDLGRNDLGKVCRAGSIEVGQIAQVLRYANVMHLGTEIFGILENEQSALSALKACFPRGTVSGAPKVRAMQILARLESEQRGPYAGAVGFIDSRGGLDCAIAIRSALIKDGQAHVTAGAGIVFDSHPESEYMETVNKARTVATVVFGLAKTPFINADEHLEAFTSTHAGVVS